MGLTIHHLQTCRDQGRPIVALTATEYTLAQILDRAGVDLVLVGDSLAMVSLGHPTTLPATVDEMLMHTQSVVRGVGRALVIADLPFGSYEASPQQAYTTAARFLKEAGAQGVKVEGGTPALAETVDFLVSRGIPVLGHLGLTPQSVHQLGGFKQQGRTPEQAEMLLESALRLQGAGAFALVLEHIPAALAQKITQEITIPTLGIGAGPNCSGQILVTHDLLGLTEKCPPFVTPLLDLKTTIQRAVERYGASVREPANKS